MSCVQNGIPFYVQILVNRSLVLFAATTILTLPDYAVIALYLISTIAVGIMIGTRMKTGTDFFLEGRRLPW
jgi:SSS family solute:Na+ symporter